MKDDKCDSVIKKRFSEDNGGQTSCDTQILEDWKNGDLKTSFLSEQTSCWFGINLLTGDTNNINQFM